MDRPDTPNYAAAASRKRSRASMDEDAASRRRRNTPRLPAPIVLDDFRAVADSRHPGPDSPHGGEDPRFLRGGDARRNGDGAQFRDRLATPFDHDNATFSRLSYQFRRVDVKLAYRRRSHMPHC